MSREGLERGQRGGKGSREGTEKWQRGGIGVETNHDFFNLNMLSTLSILSSLEGKEIITCALVGHRWTHYAS